MKQKGSAALQTLDKNSCEGGRRGFNMGDYVSMCSLATRPAFAYLIRHSHHRLCWLYEQQIVTFTVCFQLVIINKTTVGGGSSAVLAISLI